MDKIVAVLLEKSSAQLVITLQLQHGHHLAKGYDE